MKRAPIVLTGTVVGLAGVLSYNTASTPSAVIGSSSSSTAAPATTAAATSSTSTKTTASTATRSRTSTASARTRSATGQDVSFQYGDLEVKVTKSGRRIADVSIVRFGITDPHSQQIDVSAVPQLRQEAISAQSANINGVSGASYTSAAYKQSLQSALDKLA